jgi:hypothetical protein
VGEHSIPDCGPVNSVNRLVRTRMPGQSRHNICDGGWCGEGELITPLYTIKDMIIFLRPLAAPQHWRRRVSPIRQPIRPAHGPEYHRGTHGPEQYRRAVA